MGKKRKALIIYQNLEVGGVEKNIVSFLNDYDREKLEVALVLMNKKGVFCDKLADDVEIYDLQIKNKWNLLKQFISLRQVMVDYKPEVIMAVLDRMVFLSTLIRLLGREIDYKLVAVFPSYFSLRFKYMKLGWIRKLFAGFSYRLADKVMVRSQACGKDISKQLNLKREKVEVVLNSSGNKKKDRKDLMEEELYRGVLKFVYLGRLTKVKNVACLLRAVKALKEDGIGGFEVKIVGQGEKEQSLRRFCSKHGLGDVVSFVNTSMDIEEFLKGAVMVLPSWVEGCPLVLLEAKYYGAPALISDFPGCGEVVNVGVDGYVFERDNDEQLADYMKKLIEDGQLRTKLAQGAIDSSNQFCLENFVYQQEQCLVNA